jgi:hypothetical protein
MKVPDPWLLAAERFDAWRIVPRILLFGYCGFAAYLIDTIVTWYTHLPAAEQSIQNAGLITAVSTVLTGFGVPIFSIYSQNGRNWDVPQSVMTQTTVSSKTVT